MIAAAGSALGIQQHLAQEHACCSRTGTTQLVAQHPQHCALCASTVGGLLLAPGLTIFCGVSGLTLRVAAALNSGSSASRAAAASASTKLGMRWCTGRGNLEGSSSSSSRKPEEHSVVFGDS